MNKDTRDFNLISVKEEIGIQIYIKSEEYSSENINSNLDKTNFLLNSKNFIRQTKVKEEYNEIETSNGEKLLFFKNELIIKDDQQVNKDANTILTELVRKENDTKNEQLSFLKESEHSLNIKIENVCVEENNSTQNKIEHKLYQCNKCNQKFNQLSNLMYHERIHNDIQPFQCNICDRTFSDSIRLRKHKRTHTGVNYISDKSHVCKFCKKSFSLRGTLKSHERIHTGEKPFKCKTCDRAFNQATSLRRHMRIHTGEKPYRCSFCNKLYSDKSNLIVHIRTHNTDKLFQCDICDKAFSRRSNMDAHKKNHLNEKSYQCDICSKSFSYSGFLRRHEQTHAKKSDLDR